MIYLMTLEKPKKMKKKKKFTWHVMFTPMRFNPTGWL